jgi:tRNA (cytidine/uridine-2'-O-)-methyltransferase
MGEAMGSPQSRVARTGSGRPSPAGLSGADGADTEEIFEDGDLEDAVMFHLILFQPEIPPNTGNIIRLCANTGTALHLVGPLGFTLSDAKLRRAGLDYHEVARVRQHGSLPDCLEALGHPRVFAASTRGSRFHTDADFRPGDALLLGPLRTQGQVIRLPMVPGSRSLNLSNAAAVLVYEAWRQQGFPGGG